MSTNKTGSPDPETEVETPAESDGAVERPVGWHWVIIGGVVIVVALYIAVQVISVLYAIAFPPGPPLPTDTALESHSSTDYGVDDWLYNSTVKAPCEVINFYIAAGAECRLAPLFCGDTTDPNQISLSGVNTSGQNVGRCHGEIKFSIFAMSYDVVIANGDTPEVKTRFRLAREVFWSGSVPPRPDMQTDLFGDPAATPSQ